MTDCVQFVLVYQVAHLSVAGSDGQLDSQPIGAAFAPWRLAHNRQFYKHEKEFGWVGYGCDTCGWQVVSVGLLIPLAELQI